MLLDLFWTFFKLGFVSFGGGYAMIPVIEREALMKGWLTAHQFTDAVTVAGMSPGPVAMNCAVYIGYTASGLAGSIAAVLGVILPSVIIILCLSMLFYLVYQNHWVQAALTSMKPAVVALIVYAAINMTINSGLIIEFSSFTWISAIIFVAALVSMSRYRLHPMAIILASGILGIAIYA